MTQPGGAGVGAEVFERPSECHTRQPILKMHPLTGQKYWDMPRRRPLAEIILKFDVPGLLAFSNADGVTMSFEWVSKDPIDETEAIDAQCRAGWNDQACGFYGFRSSTLPDGSFVAVWKAAMSRE